MSEPIEAVLFDLDGTLLDTAPDFLFAANVLRAECGLAPMSMDELRPVVSKGGRHMVAAAFPGLDEAGVDARLPVFLARYRAHIAEHTRYFEGMASVLDELATRGLKFGIVTNKPTWLTDALLAELAITDRYLSVVCGDTLPVRKPDPAPFLLAAEQLGISPERIIMVGDDRRDTDGARRAGMRSVAAAYGYVDADDDVFAWGADFVIPTPSHLLALLT